MGTIKYIMLKIKIIQDCLKSNFIIFIRLSRRRCREVIQIIFVTDKTFWKVYYSLFVVNNCTDISIIRFRAFSYNIFIFLSNNCCFLFLKKNMGILLNCAQKKILLSSQANPANAYLKRIMLHKNFSLILVFIVLIYFNIFIRFFYYFKANRSSTTLTSPDL